MQTAFGHLNGYSAIYYTYMWSLVIAKDMFTEFKKDGLMNPQVATKYRNTVLGASGTKPAAEMVRDFLGRPYSFQAYADWLNGKIEKTWLVSWPLAKIKKDSRGSHGFTRIEQPGKKNFIRVDQ